MAREVEVRVYRLSAAPRYAGKAAMILDYDAPLQPGYRWAGRLVWTETSDGSAAAGDLLCLELRDFPGWERQEVIVVTTAPGRCHVQGKGPLPSETDET